MIINFTWGKTSSKCVNMLTVRTPPTVCFVYMGCTCLFLLQELELHYAAIGIKIPKECPLHLDNTAFYLHESMKMREHASRHICLMCGKAFYEEHFLDRHLTVRHSEVEQLVSFMRMKMVIPPNEDSKHCRN